MFFLVKEECVSEDEEEVKDTLVDEILQQGDTAIIYPEAPEDEQSPAETGGADENGNTDTQTCGAGWSASQMCIFIVQRLRVFLLIHAPSVQYVRI